MTVNDVLRRRADRALAVPLLHDLGVVLLDETEPARGVGFTVTPNALNAAGWLHAGVIATVLEAAAYLAMIEALAPDEDAITHAFAASYLAAVGPGEQLQAGAELLRRGGHLAFVSAELRSRERLIAMASVTKSLRLV
jgi:uncharacterized protein (TIGR00369 family)